MVCSIDGSNAGEPALQCNSRLLSEQGLFDEALHHAQLQCFSLFLSVFSGNLFIFLGAIFLSSRNLVFTLFISF